MIHRIDFVGKVAHHPEWRNFPDDRSVCSVHTVNNIFEGLYKAYEKPDLRIPIVCHKNPYLDQVT